MAGIKKTFWGLLGLIAAVSALLAYVASDASVFAQRIAARTGDVHPVAMTAGLVQDKVLLGSDGTVAVSVTLSAAQMPQLEHRPVRHADLVIVLDRSGSMQGSKIGDAKQAVTSLIDRLTADDRLCLVTYSSGIETVIPLTFMDDLRRRQARDAVERIYAGGGTNLGGGLRHGIHSLLQTPVSGRRQRVILISDGLANHGITDPAALGRMAAGAAQRSVSVSTVGVGYDFNEIVMTTIADHGAGSYYFLEHPDAFARVFDKEFDATRRVAASGLQLQVPLVEGVELVHAGGYPIETRDGYALIQAGDLLSGQTRKLFLTYRVPTRRGGTIALSGLTVRYQDGGVSRELTDDNELNVACVSDAKAVMSSIDRAAWGQQVVREDYNQLKESVAAAIRRGEKEKALDRIQAYETRKREINRAVGSPLVSENLDRDVESLRRSVEETFAGAPAAVERKQKQHSKALQYESYKTRRDKQ